MFSLADVESLSREFEAKTPQEIIRWAVEAFAPGIVVSSSFQTQSMPLLHMVTRIMPDIRVLFLDTGYHFWDTLTFRERIEHEWRLSVVDLYRDSRWDVFVRDHIRTLPLQDPNLCCYLHKVQPMQKALAGLQGWISGIRRDQTAQRAHAQILEPQPDGLVKINPLLNWTKADIQRYRALHNLPFHPLYRRGYRSIGCAPCTVAVSAGDDDRVGRWAGRGKTECGLHTDLFRHTNPSEVGDQFVFPVEGMP
ncbi:MAG TPA: phosphoadenylyl-sulfate reductase [Anaerolineales bacterium]